MRTFRLRTMIALVLQIRPIKMIVTKNQGTTFMGPMGTKKKWTTDTNLTTMMTFSSPVSSNLSFKMKTLTLIIVSSQIVCQMIELNSKVSAMEIKKGKMNITLWSLLLSLTSKNAPSLPTITLLVSTWLTLISHNFRTFSMVIKKKWIPQIFIQKDPPSMTLSFLILVSKRKAKSTTHNIFIIEGNFISTAQSRP